MEKDLNKLPSIYWPERVNIDRALFQPLAQQSTTLDCMTAYFTSGYLAELALALSAYISADEKHGMKLLVGPVMALEDIQALERVLKANENALPLLFGDFAISEESFRNFSIRALAYLVWKGRVELRVALKEKGIFHSKVWLFDTSQGPAVVHGSANATSGGLSLNTEHLTLNRSWRSEEGEEICQNFRSAFEDIWEGKDKNVNTRSLNSNTLEALATIARRYSPGSLSLMREKLTHYFEENCAAAPEESKNRLREPQHINYETGPYAHQGEAIEAWFENGCKGILSIATGGGKTLTSLIAATKLNDQEGRLLTIITVPSNPLLEQWAKDVEQFGVQPVISNNRRRLKRLINQLARGLRQGSSQSEVLIITHDAAVSGLLDMLAEKLPNTETLLIGDEVHNLGREQAKTNLPSWIKFRIGLSATYERQFDEDGNEFLRQYFGECVYEFGLGDAIGKCLVPYEYFPRLIHLTAEEEDEVLDITSKIRQLSYAANDEKESPRKQKLDFLRRQRRVIIEVASNKYETLYRDLLSEGQGLSKAMIFCTDKDPLQLEEVNSWLRRNGLQFHQVTGHETSDKQKLSRILQAFTDDDLQVLTSKRVLDEGFNAPQTERAFFMASRTGERQWIQRLGRVLRLSPKTNKKIARIYDYVAIPSIQHPVDKDMAYLLRSEYARVAHFSKESKNYLDPGCGYEIELKLASLMEDV